MRSLRRARIINFGRLELTYRFQTLHEDLRNNWVRFTRRSNYINITRKSVRPFIFLYDIISLLFLFWNNIQYYKHHYKNVLQLMVFFLIDV